MINIDKKMELQLFAEEKTEKATPKRRRDAREQGQVLKSMEINSALGLLAAFGALDILSEYMAEKLQGVFKTYLAYDVSMDEIFTYLGIRNMGLEVMLAIILIVGPIFAVSMVTGLIANYGQVGFLLTNKTLMPKLNRINPMEGFKRIFSKRTLVELLKSILKIAVVALSIWSELEDGINKAPGLLKTDINRSIVFIIDKVIAIGYRAGLVLLILAILDYLYQWWEYEKSLRMSKQEIKEEYKQMEGDPQVRSKIKQKQRTLAMRRMMQEVPKADVVITNPTHYAVALRYRQEEDEAPVVIAKGKDYVALKIKELAKEHDVVVMENKPLAQALYKTTDIGKTIPPELFHAVAEVLAFVYNLKRNKM